MSKLIVTCVDVMLINQPDVLCKSSCCHPYIRKYSFHNNVDEKLAQNPSIFESMLAFNVLNENLSV